MLALIEEVVDVGIAHLLEYCPGPIGTLGVSCLGVNLPRLSLALKALTDEVASVLKRDAWADDTRLFAMLARAYALCSALTISADSAVLVGRHRGQYDETGTLELSGVALTRGKLSRDTTV